MWLSFNRRPLAVVSGERKKNTLHVNVDKQKHIYCNYFHAYPIEQRILDHLSHLPALTCFIGGQFGRFPLHVFDNET